MMRRWSGIITAGGLATPLCDQTNNGKRMAAFRK